jgi:putative tricarboxylic transport membrane protein
MLERMSVSGTSWPTLAVLQFGAAAALFAAILPASAQETRPPRPGPIEITVGTGAGGTPDLVMRQVARVLGTTGAVTEPIVVQNRTGGSWTVAANWVLNKSGDEHTLLAVAGPIFTTPIAQGTRTIYDKVVPIAMFAQGEVVVAVQPDSDIGNLKDLFARAALRERGLKVSGAQVGAIDHMVTGILEKAGNVKLNYIPFDGGGAAMTAFLGKNSDMLVMSLYEAVPLVRDRKVKLIAILSEERRVEPEFKDVPTAREQGVDVTMAWGQTWGIAGPPDLDPAVVKWWESKIAAMVETAEWKKMIKDGWFRTFYLDSKGAAQWNRDVHERYVASLSNIGLAKKQ